VAARVDVPVTAITRIGVDPGATGEVTPDATNGAKFSNDGAVFLQARNSGGGAHIVTVQIPRTEAGLAVTALAVSIGAGLTRLIGPFPVATFNQGGADIGYVFVDADPTQTEMKYKAFRF